MRIQSAKRIVLLLDFDGTLTEFKKDPEAVRLDSSTRRRLERLAHLPSVKLVFISGRRRSDLVRRVGVKEALYLGLHGFERSQRPRISPASRRSVVAAHRFISRRIRGLAGVQTEDKGASLVLRYRGASASAAAKARLIGREALAAPGVRLNLLHGKRIMELLAPEVDGKGSAAAKIIERAGEGALPVYVGDDRTDETAFRALRGAVTVKVGTNQRTHAHYWVRNPDEVKMMLARIEDALKRESPPPAL
ncbi:MAG: trehalose-phosphatase [Acidobacteriota bacterium]|nr:trehalose-phosphatase [Acidobacteriota bacterium]